MTDLFSALPTILNNIWLYGILVLVVISAVIFVHEMGHYLVGRALGFKIELFSLGFGRELIGRTDRRGTRWSLRLFPIGGYVKFFGEHLTPEVLALPEEQLRQAYLNKPVGQRSLVAVAGPAFNFIFSFLLLVAIYMSVGRPTPAPYVMGIEVGSPAERMGIEIGDLILNIGGVPISGIDQARELVRNKIGQTLEVKVERDGKILTMSGAPKRLPEKNDYGLDSARGYFGWMWPVYGLSIKEVHAVDGIDTRGNPDRVRELVLANANKRIVINFGRDHPVDYLVDIHPELNQAMKDSKHKDYDILTLGRRPSEDMKTLPFGQASYKAGDLIWRAIHKTLGSIFQVIIGTKKTNELGGVIKIGATTGQMLERGVHTLMTYVALLSVSIGMVNLLPIPLLDGGHLMFYAMEAAKGSPVSLKTRGYIYGFGLIFLLMTILVININDLLYLFSKF